MNDEQENDRPDPLTQLLLDLRETGKPSGEWLEAHARDGRFREAWLATFEPVDVWRVLNYAPVAERYVRLAAVSATMAASALGRFSEVHAARPVVTGWLAGEQVTPEPLSDARDVLMEAAESQTLGLDEMCAASAFMTFVEMLHEHRAGALTIQGACTQALSVVEDAVDALALERRESVFRDMCEAGVGKAQAERVSLLAFECAEEARGAELAARLAAAIECPRLDELDALAEARVLGREGGAANR